MLPFRLSLPSAILEVLIGVLLAVGSSWLYVLCKVPLARLIEAPIGILLMSLIGMNGILMLAWSGWMFALSRRVNAGYSLHTCLHLLAIQYAIRIGKGKLLGISFCLTILVLTLLQGDLAGDGSAVALALFLSGMLGVFSMGAIPPGVIFLAVTSEATYDTKRRIAGAVFPLRVVSLLNMKLIASRWNTARLEMHDDLRIVPDQFGVVREHHWRPVVQFLMDVSSAVVIDARNCSPYVVYEINQVLNSRHYRKSLFIVSNLGERPALDAAIDDGSPNPSPDRLFTESAVIDWLRRAMKSRKALRDTLADLDRS